jgi:hypothetical protein
MDAEFKILKIILLHFDSLPADSRLGTFINLVRVLKVPRQLLLDLAAEMPPEAPPAAPAPAPEEPPRRQSFEIWLGR